MSPPYIPLPDLLFIPLAVFRWVASRRQSLCRSPFFFTRYKGEVFFHFYMDVFFFLLLLFWLLLLFEVLRYYQIVLWSFSPQEFSWINPRVLPFFFSKEGNALRVAISPLSRLPFFGIDLILFLLS